MSTSSPHPLFTPLRVGNVIIQHRVAMAPLTRYRADDDHVPTDMMVEYYAQRASMPGTLLITEGTIVSPRAGGCDNAPGIWSEQQVKAWRKVVDTVREHKSFMFLQLWALGRSASPAVLAKEAEKAGLPVGAYPYVSASDIPPTLKYGRTPDILPRPLTEEEIEEYVLSYALAAQNAVDGAGFDGVEINFANGYLPDQFLQDVSNARTDAYGGSLKSRAKFPLRVLDAVVARVGAARTSIRISPWNDYQGMRMADPIPTFAFFISEARRLHPCLAYVHAVEGARPGDSNDFVRAIWKEGSLDAVFLSASGHNRKSALQHAEKGDVVVFGKWFISNPDLPRRIRQDIPFNAYDFSTFYAKMSPKGYTDYPFTPELPLRLEEPAIDV